MANLRIMQEHARTASESRLVLPTDKFQTFIESKLEIDRTPEGKVSVGALGFFQECEADGETAHWHLQILREGDHEGEPNDIMLFRLHGDEAPDQFVLDEEE